MAKPHEIIQGRHVLVTGGAGYLGSVLVPKLLDLGHQVTVIDCCIFGSQSLDPVADHPSLTVHRQDIVSAGGLSSLLREVDVVVHLASISNDPTADLDPNLTIRTNYLSTRDLARRSRAEGVQQFLFASSCSVYGASSSRLLDEQSQTGPVTLYALTKLASEREVLELGSEDFRVTVLRLSTLFGLSPRMRFDLAVNVMSKRGIQKKNLIVNGKGEQYRPFVHVRDASDAIVRVLRSDPQTVRGQIFNLGGDHLNLRIRELAEEIRKSFPDMGIEHRESNHDIRSYRVRFEKIREMVGFTPKVSIPDAVAEISAAYEQGSLGTLEEDRYYNLAVMKRLQDEGALSGSPWIATSS